MAFMDSIVRPSDECEKAQEESRCEEQGKHSERGQFKYNEPRPF
jgi:hypothetical protein